MYTVTCDVIDAQHFPVHVFMWSLALSLSLQTAVERAQMCNFYKERGLDVPKPGKMFQLYKFNKPGAMHCNAQYVSTRENNGWPSWNITFDSLLLCLKGTCCAAFPFSHIMCAVTNDRTLFPSTDDVLWKTKSKVLPYSKQVMGVHTLQQSRDVLV